MPPPQPARSPRADAPVRDARAPRSSGASGAEALVRLAEQLQRRGDPPDQIERVVAVRLARLPGATTSALEILRLAGVRPTRFAGRSALGESLAAIPEVRAAMERLTAEITRDVIVANATLARHGLAHGRPADGVEVPVRGGVTARVQWGERTTRVHLSLERPPDVAPPEAVATATEAAQP